MANLTVIEVTRQYLYGRTTQPTPTSLVDEALTRRPPYSPADATFRLQQDFVSYMTDGPGRFALGFQFRFVNNFFARDEEGNYIFDIPVGTYDQTDGPNGITQYVDWAGQPRHIGFSNWQYDDGRGDYGSRTYIWGTVAFDIVNSAQFVVTASGERYIDNYVVRPFLNEGAIENFDFTRR
jgi:hypothetical protein